MENMQHTYECKDGRTRIYNPATQKVTSYPRFLMEQKLGRPLDSREQVHHIDENPLNNDLNNLEIKIEGEHQREHATKYHDKMMVCPNCGKEFIWTARAQRTYYANRSRVKQNKNPINKVFCSKHCIGQYSRSEQLKRNS